MTVPEFHTVCFVGAGTMGCYNALVAALAGYRAVLFDHSADALEQAAGRQTAIAAHLIQDGSCTKTDVALALSRTTLSFDLAQATDGAGLISESVFERLELKRELHRTLDELCPPSTILTTNTSALPISDIASVVRHGERFAALHSHLGTSLIDIVRGPRTSESTIETLERYVLSLGGHPLVLKRENPGYVLNAMIGPLLGTSVALVLDGLATPEDVDRAWMLNRRAVMGPFGMMDLIGIDVVCDGFRNSTGRADPHGLRPRITAFLSEYVDKAQLGSKTGRGFYTYPDPAYAQSDFKDDANGLALPHLAMTASLFHYAALLALHDVAAPEQIDEAWKVGMRLDLGPFQIMDEMGADGTQALLDSAAAMFDSEQAERVCSYLRARPWSASAGGE